ncbi:hypothetical protein PIB30_065801 [Stylosanthes scabra]|uniref:Uncharacterized protein n=1 Tax=Stylosanthes scabra TaxID=79078 RepID=A0ABU6SN38_9FABA|nr:hypothetical protein [Stylosanthes scabra]
MKQALAVALARSYNNDQMSMVLETEDIPLTAPLILYFHSNKHGLIKKCISKDEPWTKEWTTTELKRVSKKEVDQPSGLIKKIEELRKYEREKSNKSDTPNRAPNKRRRVSPDSSTTADSYVAREIPKGDDDGDVGPIRPSFNLGISQDEIDVSVSLSPKTVDVDGGPLVPIRVIIPPDFNEVEQGRVYRWVMDDK